MIHCSDVYSLFIFLVLVYQLMAHLEFALAYRNPLRLSSEAQYFVVTLTSAVHFLLELDEDQVDMDPEEFRRHMCLPEPPR